MGSIKYVKAFDGLRGIAVLMLFVYHFPGKYINMRHGWEFMQMFFVMSGYLISLALLEDRTRYPFKEFALNFYSKRALRLFPLYFAYIFLCLVINAAFSGSPLMDLSFAKVAYHAKYLLTFTFNYMQFINQALGKDYSVNIFCGHLWTISLEEQFYLVFPLIFFFCDLKTIKKLSIACIVIAPVFRVLFFIYMRHTNPDDVIWASVNLSRIPFAQMDSLALGAALAVFNMDWIKNAARWWMIFLIVIVLAYLINIFYVYKIQGLNYYQVTYGFKIVEKWITHNYLFAYIITLVNIWCALTLLCVRRNAWFVKALEIKPLVFLGKLSYGIYILHLPIMACFVYYSYFLLGGQHLKPYILHECLLFVVYFFTVVTISYISYTYFESYFLNMKKRFKSKNVTT